MAFLQLLALLATTALFSGVSAQCSSDPEVDLCPFVTGYDTQPSLFSDPGCPDDPESDLCAGVSSSPAGTCPDDPESDLCDLKPPGTCPDDPESDLCDGKVWMPCPDDPDVDLCSPSPSPSPSPTPAVPSPSPSPTPEVPSPSPGPAGTCPDDPDVDLCSDESPSPSPSPAARCPDDPEMDLCDGESPSPSPSPTPEAPSPSPSPTPEAPSPSPSPTPEAPSPSPSPTPEAPSPSPSPTSEAPSPSPSPTPTTTTTTAIIKVASFGTALEMDDVTKFDEAKFIESVSSSQEAAEEVVVESVSYQVEVQYTLPETMTQTNVRDTIAAAQNLPVENVNATKSARRLAASQRRLAAAWDVVIKTSDASAVDSIATKATDKEAIQAAAQVLNIADVTVEVTNEPKKKVAVQFKVKSKPDAAEAVQTVDTTKLSEELGKNLGVEVAVGPVEFQGEEEEIKSPPSPSPSPSPSPTPSVPTVGDEVESGTKTLSCLFAFQLVLAGIVAGLQF